MMIRFLQAKRRSVVLRKKYTENRYKEQMRNFQERRER